MSDSNTTPAAKSDTKSGGKIRKVIGAPWWVRAMRFFIAAVAAFMLYHVAMRLKAGHMPPSESWLVGLIGAIGLSALVEATWPKGNHGLLQFWLLTLLAASGIATWFAGGDQWIGIMSAITLAGSFVLAVIYSATSRGGDAS